MLGCCAIHHHHHHPITSTTSYEFYHKNGFNSFYTRCTNSFTQIFVKLRLHTIGQYESKWINGYQDFSQNLAIFIVRTRTLPCKVFTKFEGECGLEIVLFFQKFLAPMKSCWVFNFATLEVRNVFIITKGSSTQQDSKFDIQRTVHRDIFL